MEGREKREGMGGVREREKLRFPSMCDRWEHVGSSREQGRREGRRVLARI